MGLGRPGRTLMGALRWVLVLLFAGCSGAVDPALPVVEHVVAPVVKPVATLAVYRVPVEPLIPTRAIELIIAFEVGSPEVYQAKYRHPIWPKGQSGVTIGVGYDLGYRLPQIIVKDWEREPHKVRLASAAGVSGPLARELARNLADITIEYGYAREVFDMTSLVEHYRLSRRAFGRPFDDAPAMVRGALTSVVFNRGSGMKGETRREMRTIRDVCLPSGNWSCVAAEIRAMTRIWEGTDIGKGMFRRRNAEANLIEVGI